MDSGRLMPMHGEVTHFEIPADDTKRAKTFYTNLFGWKMEPWQDSSYLFITTNPKKANPSDNDVSGGLDKRSEYFQAPVITVHVDSIDRALAETSKLGGSVARGKSPVGDFGFAAYIKDTENNVVGLFERKTS
jgi:predicted enzyme related to lactoylglutathione lyase